MQAPHAAPIEDATQLSEEAWARLLTREPAQPGLSPLYAPLLRGCARGRYVIGRIAQSLDGRIATSSGQSFWISGPEDILHTHRLRALFDVLVVGAGTVRADDPKLTTRLCAGPSPVRVVVDTDRRLGADFGVFRDGAPTLLACAEDAGGPDRVGTAEVLRLPRSAASGLDLPVLLDRLAARGLKRVLVEGGGITVSRFLTAGVLDRLHVTIAPLLLGEGVPGFTLPGVDRPEQARRVIWTPYRLGADILLDIPLERS